MKGLIYDLKFLTGVIFCYLGLVLTIYGLFTNKQTEHFPFNANLWWGIITLLFGLAFFAVSVISNKKNVATEKS